jgi:anti-sigma B factor antagonist
MPQFEHVLLDDGSGVVRLEGEIDMAVVADLQDSVRRALAHCDAVELDLTAVTFLDSSGLGALVLLRNEARDQDKQLSLSHLPKATERLLVITGLKDTFLIRET